jgi:hypothetical protein
MQDSFSELIKLLLPEIVVDYFELTSYEKGEEYFIYIKLIQSPKVPTE